MNVVSFPDWYLTLNVPYVAFKFLKWNIPWFVCIIFVGICLVLYLASRSKEKYYVRFRDLLEVLAVAAFAGFIGARLFYVFFNVEKYLEDPIKVLYINDHGFQVLGGIVVGFWATRRMCKTFDFTIKDVFDYMAPFFAMMQVVVCAAALFHITDYGLHTTQAIFKMGIDVPKVGYVEMYGIFVYEFFLCLGIAIFTRWLQPRRRFQGQIYHYYLLLYGLGRFYIEGLRQNQMLIAGFNFGKIICFIFVIDAISFLGINYIRRLNNPDRHIQE